MKKWFCVLLFQWCCAQVLPTDTLVVVGIPMANPLTIDSIKSEIQSIPITKKVYTCLQHNVIIAIVPRSTGFGNEDMVEFVKQRRPYLEVLPKITSWKEIYKMCGDEIQKQ